MKKAFLSSIATIAILFTNAVAADHHETGPLGYGMAFNMKVSDPAALAGAMTKVRTSNELSASPSSVSLNQIVAGGPTGATHSILVFYPTLADIDKTQAMNAGSKVMAEVGPVFQSAAERISVNMFTMLRMNVPEGAVTSPENSVSFGYQLAVTDQGAFMAAFDKLWAASVKSFPGNAYFGTVLANGESPATHFVSFTANDMETLLGGMEELLSSDAMAEYSASAASFRSIVGESINRRLLNFPAPAN